MADITITLQKRRLATEALWQIEALLETLPLAMKGLDKFSLTQAVVVRVQQLSGIVGNVLDGDAGEEDYTVLLGVAKIASGEHEG